MVKVHACLLGSIEAQCYSTLISIPYRFPLRVDLIIYFIRTLLFY